MFRVTESASDRLEAMLGDAPDNVVVRIVFGFKGLEFQCSAVCPGDSTFRRGGRVLLDLDKHLSNALSERTLDMRSSNDGPTLDLR